MKKRALLVLVITVVFSILQSETSYAEETSLQALINATPKGGTLYLENKLYSESIVINQPIRIIGKEDTGLQACSQNPALTILGENVQIENIKISSCLGVSESASVFVIGKNHVFKNIVVEADQVGLYLENVNGALFENIHVIGAGKRNGFEVWNSEDNLFTRNTIENVADGFYLENSHHNRLTENEVTNARYGIHVMYSDWIQISNNQLMYNVTGAMIMETTGTFVEKNMIGGNKQNVNAQGLLLYDVYQSTIQENYIGDNRVGIFMENSTDNLILNNEVHANFIGAQLSRIYNNTIKNNSFTNNVNEIQAIKSANNSISNNFWDQAAKLDLYDDGKSDIPYHADPYFLYLTKEVPEFQLFFQHPGMNLLQKMLKSSEKLLITDTQPLMEKPWEPSSKRNEMNLFGAWITSLIMVTISTIFIIIGRRKKCIQ
ncbi:right-handed parallel beta-helix repeat-containing protein [Bacillus kwashiorkori]|uniref:right-handed parallel beta-helix repeat-containing protein n=1 Tax=Bacillus kwashiorkori TaxID=1522318 RepID=UPI000783C058|nr:NosD domain-containing protein [Bacillus kwashiorkori]